MDTKLQQLRRAYCSEPSIDALLRVLSCKARVLPHTVLEKTETILGDVIKAPLKAALIHDIEWCELEHNRDPWTRNLYIDAPREWIATVLTAFCGWEETNYHPHGRTNIYLNRGGRVGDNCLGGDNCFVRTTTPTEAVRFFYEHEQRMGKEKSKGNRKQEKLLLIKHVKGGR